MNKINIAHTKTDCFEGRDQRKMLSHDTSGARLEYKMKGARNQRQVSGANNSARNYFRGTKEDMMRISNDFKPSFNLPENTIDREIPFTSDYHSPKKHTPKHN